MKVVNLEDCINEIKSLDNCGFITRSTNHVCEDLRTELKGVPAVPLDRIEELRSDVSVLREERRTIECQCGCASDVADEVLELIDKLIAEVEG